MIKLKKALALLLCLTLCLGLTPAAFAGEGEEAFIVFDGEAREDPAEEPAASAEEPAWQENEPLFVFEEDPDAELEEAVEPTEPEEAGEPEEKEEEALDEPAALPVITAQPEDVTAAAGKTAVFRLTAEGAESYQWQYSTNGGANWGKSPAAGNQTDTLTVPATKSRSGYLYRCRVTNAAGTVTSEAAALTVIVKPVITAQPEDVTAAEDGTAVFTVEAGGAESYQWQYSKNGGVNWANALSDGSRTDTLTVPATAANNGRLYRCKVTNAAGTVTSEAALLTVLLKPVITAQPEGATAASGRTAVFRLTAEGADSYQWQYSWDGGTTWADSPAAGNRTDTLSVTAAANKNGWLYRCKVTNDAGTAESEAAALTVIVKPVITAQPEDATAAEGRTAVFTVEASGADTCQWQYSKNGGTSWANSPADGSRTATLTVPAAAANSGWLFRCRLTNAAGTVTSEAAALTVIVKPVITAQPESAAAVPGTRAVFTVEATGADSYQWQYSADGGASWANTSADGNKTAALSIPVTKSRSGYLYRCKVTNAAGTVMSEAAALTVIPKPAITAQPENATAAAGRTAVFTVEAEGAESWQWQFSWDGGTNWGKSPAAGNQTDTLSVTAAENKNGYLYRCKVTNAAGTVTSEAAALTVIVKPVVTAQPEDAAVPEGSTAVFTVEAEGADSCQWQYSTNGGASWTDASDAGCKSAALSVPAEASRSGWLYRCRLTNLAGSVCSDSAALFVYTLPEFQEQPQDLTGREGFAAVFTAGASGGGIAYRWEESADGGTWTDSAAAGHDTDTLTVVISPETDGLRFRCIAGNPAGESASRAALLTMIPEGIAIDETNFPDANFRAAVSGFDTDGNGYLKEAELAAVTEIDCSGCDIASLQGVEHFTTLTVLNCSGNQLTGLDLSANTALTELRCGSNALASLDLSANTALTVLNCSDNQLTGLDISANAALTILDCSGNGLTGLNLSANTALTRLNCSHNALTALDASACSALTGLDCDNNAIAQLDVSGCTGLKWLACQTNALGSLDLSGITLMERAILEGSRSTVSGEPDYYMYLLPNESGLLVDSGVILTPAPPPAVDEANFPDANFRALVSGFDTDGNGSLSEAELAAVTVIDCSGCDIASLQGVEFFTALTELRCGSNALTSLDLSANIALTMLRCSGNALTDLNLSANAALTVLNCSDNQLTGLDVSANAALTVLDCSGNQLTSLDVSANTELTELHCDGNALTSLDLSLCPALCDAVETGTRTAEGDDAWHFQNGDADLYVDRAAALTPPDLNLEISEANFPDGAFRSHVAAEFDTNGDGSLSEAERAAVTEIDCTGQGIASLQGVEFFTALTELRCGSNQLTSLDLSANTALTKLRCGSNQLTSLDLSANIALTMLNCSDNQLTGVDVSVNTALTELVCSGNQLTSLDVSANTGLLTLCCNDNQLTDLDVSLCPALNEAIETGTRTACGAGAWHFQNGDADLYVDRIVALTPPDLNLEISEANFPDSAFRSHIAAEFDTNGDGVLSASETAAVTEIDCSGCDIASLQGIEFFTALTKLFCGGNELTGLDLRANTALTELRCSGNELTGLDLRANTALLTLCCDENQLTDLDLSRNTALTELRCGSNALTDLDLSANAALETLRCEDNELAGLSLSSCTALKELYCGGNELTSLDLSANTALTELDCGSNQLTGLDMSANTALETLRCDDNELTGLDVSANTALTVLDCSVNRLESLDLSPCTALNDAILSGTRTACGAGAWQFALGDANVRVDRAVALTPPDPNAAAIDETNFPDALFRGIVSGFDTDGDGALSVSESRAVTEIDCSGQGIASLQGIEFFTALTELHCGGNELTGLDLSANTALELLDCGGNRLTGLDLSRNTALETLRCEDNELTSLDLVANTALTKLSCDGNELAGLDVSASPALSDAIETGTRTEKSENAWLYEKEDAQLSVGKTIAITPPDPRSVKINETNFPDGNFRAVVSGFDANGDGVLSEIEIAAVTELDCSGQDLVSLRGIACFTALTKLNCGGNRLTSLDLSANTGLTKLNCSGNRLANLSLSGCPALTDLNCASNALTSLNVNANTALELLDCGNNRLAGLNVNANTGLTVLRCGGNRLESLDVSANTALTELNCSGNALTDLNVNANTGLTVLDCTGNALTGLDVSACPALSEAILSGTRTAFGAAAWQFALGDAQLRADKAAALTPPDPNPLAIDGTNFPDAVFRGVVSGFDTDGDGLLSGAEIAAVTEIDCSGQGIASLQGIEFFTALTKLNCGGNELTSLDVSANTALEELNCSGNGLAELELSGCPALTVLDCGSNALSSLDVSASAALSEAILSGTRTEEGENAWLYEKENAQLTVDRAVELTPPYYTLPAAWSERIPEIQSAQAGKFTIAVQTDTHFGAIGTGIYPSSYGDIMNSLSKLTEYVDFDFICNLGDIIRGYDYDTTEDMLDACDEVMRRYERNLHCPLLVIPGNHDTNRMYAEAQGDPSLQITKETIYSKIIPPVQNSAPDAVFNGSSLYYYLDHEDAGIRTIFLNSTDGNYTGSEIGDTFVISNEQLNWFETVALDTDKAIMVFCHCPLADGMHKNTVKNHVGIMDAIHAFKNAGGTVIGCFYGHTHTQDSMVDGEGVLHVTFTCGGTCAEVVMVDTENRTISTVAIGKDTKGIPAVDRAFTF